MQYRSPCVTVVCLKMYILYRCIIPFLHCRLLATFRGDVMQTVADVIGDVAGARAGRRRVQRGSAGGGEQGDGERHAAWHCWIRSHPQWGSCRWSVCVCVGGGCPWIDRRSCVCVLTKGHTELELFLPGKSAKYSSESTGVRDKTSVFRPVPIVHSCLHDDESGTWPSCSGGCTVLSCCRCCQVTAVFRCC